MHEGEITDRLRCPYCAEPVGMYEPVRLLLPDGTEQHGSVLTLGDRIGAAGALVVHESCYAAWRSQGHAQATG